MPGAKMSAASGIMGDASALKGQQLNGCICSRLNWLSTQAIEEAPNLTSYRSGYPPPLLFVPQLPPRHSVP
jgi:hypothetical protein